MAQVIAWIIVIALIIAIIGFIFKHLIGFIGIGLVIWGVYKWRVNRKRKAKSYLPIIISVIGIVIAISWFGSYSPDKDSTDVAAPEERVAEQQEDNTEGNKEEEKAEKQTDEEKVEKPEEAEQEQVEDETKKENVQEEKESQTITEKQDETPKSGLDHATVTRIVDGDTIELRFDDGSVDTIRLLLVDTPETKHPSLPVQKFGPEASQFANNTLLNEKVQVEYDGPKRDKYDRLLGYLWIGDKIFNQMLLEKGLARYAYVYDPPYTYQNEFLKAQNRAKNDKIGIWSIDGYVTPDGFNQTNQPQSNQPTNVGEYTGPYDPFGADRDCGDFSTQNEAQAFYKAAGGPDSDRHRLDRNNDGMVCESLP